jgi:predicted nucleic-acid-binding protein
MRITVDTNVLIRAVVRDDAEQARLADSCLRNATVIAVTLPCLCEFVWVLRRLYGFRAAEISAAIGALLVAANVEANRPAVEAGLGVLDAGGDFADGVIAHEGEWLGGKTFLSFDQKAVALLSAQGREARAP